MRAFHRGRELPLGGPQARSVLAILLLSAGLTVSKDRLIECAWTDDPPPTAGDLVAAYVSRLRKALAPAAPGLRLRSVRPGFRADVDPALVHVDAHEFSLLMRSAGREQEAFEHELAIRTLRCALDLWGGYTEAMTDLDAPWLRSQAAALGERRLDALEQLGALQLAAGQPADAIALLAETVRLHPERESMAVTLIDSLTSSGRQAQAAQAAADAATALVRLGQQPGPELRRAQTAALARRSPAPSVRRVGPRFQLPADTGAFTGRRRELDRLLEFVHRAADAPEAPGSAGPGTAEGAERTEDAAPAPRPGQVLIAAIDGMGGIGKSALAVHLAHRIADRYPDGQLFVDLRAYTSGHPPRDPHEVLETILRMLGTTPDEIPADLDGRSAMLRGRLAGTRTLILLDNALDEAQIRPLLPGSEGCLVLITSRRRLKGLDEAFSLSLDLLPDADAAALFRAVAGPGRVELTAPALAEVVSLCARLPLALRIAAAILRHRSTWGVDRLAARLRAGPDRVEALTDGERDLSAIFDLSYLALSADARALYRWLGIQPGLDVDVYAAAALARTDPATVGVLIEQLVDHNLLDEPSPGRYRTHDLIRIHASGRAVADEPADRLAAAARRALGYYLATARIANRHLARRTLLVDKPECPPVIGPTLATREEASEWVRAEFGNLSACVEYSREHDLPEFIVAMSAALHGYLYTHGPWSYALELHERAEVAATACGDALGRATALHCAGRVRRQTGDYPGAIAALQGALDLYMKMGHVHGQAHVRDTLGRISWLTGDYPSAIEAFDQALPLYRRALDPLGEAGALNGMGRVRRLTGDLPDAVRLHREALALCRAAGDPISQATALTDLGRALGDTGDRLAAGDALNEALRLYRETDHALGQANALHELGRIHRRAAEDRAAADCQQRALDLYTFLGHVWGQARALVELGLIWCRRGDAVGAAAGHLRALTLFRQVGDARGEAAALNGYGAALAASGDLDRGYAACEQALKIARAVSSPVDEADAEEGLAANSPPGSAAERAHARRAREIRVAFEFMDV